LDNSPILELKNVVAGYGRATILNGTTFSVGRGAITTIIGPNGAGKSTVFKTVFGLLAVRQGRIMFDGRDVTGLPVSRLISLGMCYVPQGRNIFPELSVRSNLQLGAFRLPPQEVNGLVEAAMEQFPLLRRKASAQASVLSGGEQKLLEVARGLMLKPKLMLIDEPSIGLSPKVVQEIFALLKHLSSQGTSILMVEQNARSALQLSDFGIVLEQGQTRIAGTAQSILGDSRIGQLFLGGGAEGALHPSG